MGWFAARSEARRTFRWFWTPDKSLLGLVRSEHWIRSGLLAAPIPSDVMSLAPVGEYRAGRDAMLAGASDVTFAAGTELSLPASLSKRSLREVDEKSTPALGRGLLWKNLLQSGV